MPEKPKKATELKGQIGYLVDARQQLHRQHQQRAIIDQNMLNQGGYRIHTTFDKKKINQMRDAVKTGHEGEHRPEEAAPSTSTSSSAGPR